MLSEPPELLVPVGGGVGLEVFVFPVVDPGGLVGIVGVVFPVVPVGVVGVLGVVVVFVGVVVVPVGVVVPGVVVLATIWVKFAVHNLSLVI